MDAASNPDVKQIVMNFSTGGGSVNGVNDLGKMIQKIDAVKPVVGFTNDRSMSAGYWLMSSARQVVLADTAMVGSIGVLTVHMERSAQMAQNGVKATVLRAGEFKALANPYEPLTPAATAEIQGQLSDLYDMFAGHVQDMRGLSASEMNAAGQGREFMGKRAISSGLADKVLSADKLSAYVKKVDTTKPSPDNRNKSKGASAMIRKDLTAIQLAAIAAGAPTAQVMLLGEPQVALTAEQIAAAAVTAQAALDETARIAAEAATAETARVAAAAEAAKPIVVAAPAVDAVVAHLTQQLAAANADVVAAKIEAASFKAFSETHEGLLNIARESVGKMAVALGGSNDQSMALDAKAAITEYARITDVFKTKFKVGQVSAATPVEGQQVVADPRFASAVKSAPSARK